jgi:hypothetical protein
MLRIYKVMIELGALFCKKANVGGAESVEMQMVERGQMQRYSRHGETRTNREARDQMSLKLEIQFHFVEFYQL